MSHIPIILSPWKQRPIFRGVKKSCRVEGSEALVGRWRARVSDRLLQCQASADRNG